MSNIFKLLKKNHMAVYNNSIIVHCVCVRVREWNRTFTVLVVNRKLIKTVHHIACIFKLGY